MGVSLAQAAQDHVGYPTKAMNDVSLAQTHQDHVYQWLTKAYTLNVGDRVKFVTPRQSETGKLGVIIEKDLYWDDYKVKWDDGSGEKWCSGKSLQQARYITFPAATYTHCPAGYASVEESSCIAAVQSMLPQGATRGRNE